jgi:MFS family permease
MQSDSSQLVCATAVAAEKSEASGSDSRNAKLYLTGLAVSLVGNSALSLVAGIWVKSLTGSSARAGLVSACIYLPALAGPVAGVVADRANRQRLLVAINLAMGVAVLLLLGVRSASQVWLIYVVMVLYGAQAVASAPAEAALFAEMLPVETRLKMNGWRLGIQETGRVVAPILGAGVFAVAGGGVVAVLDSATFMVAALTISLLRFKTPARVPTDPRLWRELTAGVRYIARERELRTVVLAATGAMAVSGVAVPAQYSLVSAIGQQPAFLGVLSGMLGLGSIIASLSAGRLRQRIGDLGLAGAGLANFIASALLYAIGFMPAAVLGAFVSGFALPWVFLAAVNAAQRLAPVELQGRVSAAVMLGLFGPLAPMVAVGSLIISQTGFRQVYIGVAIAIGALALWLRRSAIPTTTAALHP